MSIIDVNKIRDDTQLASGILENNDKIQNMEEEIKKFFLILEKPNADFKPDIAFDNLFNYIIKYERVLYSTISNIIYARYDSSSKFDPAGTLLSNLDKLVKYSEDDNNIFLKKKYLNDDEKEVVDSTRKVILKIWDHVTLASHQYTMLKQTDEEYDEKFKKRIATYKEEMSKEMNAQMITMVSIFTALAFLIFGSISSLDGVFENLDMPIFKVMSIGVVWGICVLNMIFVFLYCIGKMTKLNFKASERETASIFQKYPVVWWTNFVLLALLLVTSWGHIVKQTAMGEWIINNMNCNPKCIFILGTALIGIVLRRVFIFLSRKTQSDK